jgi:hypothetical protein
MPIQASVFRLPSGARGVRADCIGTVTKEEVGAWLRQIDPDGPFHGLPVLAVALQLDRLTPEARGVYAKLSNSIPGIERWIAVVGTNPVIRVTANFVMRITKKRKMRLFRTEEEAVRWLDEHLRADAAEKAAP